MMVRCAESLNPDYSMILSISTASDMLTIFLFSPDIFQIYLNYMIYYLLPFIVSSILVGTRGDCAFLSFFFSVSRSILVWWLLVRLLPVVTRDWHVYSYSTLWVRWSFQLFPCTGKIFLYCQHTKLQVMRSLYHLYHEFAPVSFSLFNFSLASIDLFLVKNGYDKPNKTWRSLYVVVRTGKKSKYV